MTLARVRLCVRLRVRAANVDADADADVLCGWLSAMCNLWHVRCCVASLLRYLLCCMRCLLVKLRLAVTACFHYNSDAAVALTHMKAEEFELVLELGDNVYNRD